MNRDYWGDDSDDGDKTGIEDQYLEHHSKTHTH